MKKTKIFILLCCVFSLFFITQAPPVKAGTDPYWENQKRLTKMVYGPFFAYRTGTQLNGPVAKVPASFENKVRNAVLRKHGSINPNKTYRVRWYQKLTPTRYGGTTGQAVGFYCEN